MDPGIFLFGKKIHLPETAMITDFPACSTAARGGGLVTEERTCVRVNREDEVAEMACSAVYRKEHAPITPHDRKDEAKPEDESDDNPKTPSIDEETLPEKSPATGAEGEPKSLKKPDKILPCPRCDSMDTKFCYYNNCNVNQPRHFCKSCQRYWTAGGTMRNMPVGAGRRKKKIPASSHCRFITISQEAFRSAAAPQIEFAADSDVPPQKVLSFGSNPPHSGGRDAGDDCSGESTVTTSNSAAEKVQDNNGFPCQVPWMPYNPWNSAIPIPFPIPGYPPMPIYPSYWSSVSWLPLATSAPNFPIIGKRSRNGEAVFNGSEEDPKKQKHSVLIPKTLRIDDPNEAAKSSIWATLGIKNENSSRGDLFKAFQSKGDEKKKHTPVTNSPVLQANPAAFSRSLCFQERA